MKKKIAAFSLSVLFLCFAFPLTASAESVNAVNISVDLDENGTAHVTEVWQIDATQGTEWYLNKDNMRDMQISDFAVSDETGLQYVNEGAWDVDRSREQKAGKCGIVQKNNGYELCWGLGDYGERTYTVRYIMTNFVKSYTDYDGFNVRFINDKMSNAPAQVDLSIRAPQALAPEKAGVWAFGFAGEIYVQDGAVHAWSNEPLQVNNHVTVMVRFDKGMFAPTSMVEQPFSDLEEQAKESSDYGRDDGHGGQHEDGDISAGNFFTRWMPGLLFIGLCGVIVSAFAFGKSTAGEKIIGLGQVSSRDVEYCRDIPCEGNLPASYVLLKEMNFLKTDGPTIGAYLLRWSYRHLVRMEETEKTTFLGVGGGKQPSIVLQNDAGNLQGAERSLYQMMQEASGGDSILQEKEFYKWSKKNYTKVEAWLEELAAEGRRQLRAMGAIASRSTKRFFGLIDSEETVLTEHGQVLAQQLTGFQKYLKDFTIINERKPVEVELWDEYLVFAVLFGIADQVAKEFKELYPKHFEQQNDMGYGTGGDIFWTMVMVQNMSRAASRGVNAGRSATQSNIGSGGGGGFSSMGGGGGFSGGGSGGGSR